MVSADNPPHGRELSNTSSAGISASDASLEYHIDTEAGILRQRWRGNVSARHVVNFWRELVNDRPTLSVGKHLNDLRDCRLDFSGNEWMTMIKTELEGLPFHASWQAAVVVNSIEMVGVVRQFMGYAGDLVAVEIFDDMASAEAWLLADENHGHES